MGNIWTDTKAWIEAPFAGTKLSVYDITLLVGLVAVLAILWGFVLNKVSTEL